MWIKHAEDALLTLVPLRADTDEASEQGHMLQDAKHIHSHFLPAQGKSTAPSDSPDDMPRAPVSFKVGCSFETPIIGWWQFYRVKGTLYSDEVHLNGGRRLRRF